MRSNPTKSEAVIWKRLANQQQGIKFRRQEVILGWIADFYCAPAKLVIEIDGGYHVERQKQDARRDSVMRANGLEVIRFSSDLASSEPGFVVRQIVAAAKRRIAELNGNVERAPEGLCVGVR